MKFPSNRSIARLTASAVALAVGAVLILALGLAAAGNTKSGKYVGAPVFQGTKLTSVTINFKVNASKTKVQKLRLTPFIPNACGSGGPPPKEAAKAATINGGKFTDTVKELKTSGGFFGKAIVKGQLKSGGKVKGSFKSTIPGHPECSAKYTFTAKTGGG